MSAITREQVFININDQFGTVDKMREALYSADHEGDHRYEVALESLSLPTDNEWRSTTRSGQLYAKPEILTKVYTLKEAPKLGQN